MLPSNQLELGLWLEKFCLDNPEARGVILESHGLFTWGDTPQECYETTLWAINTAATWLDTPVLANRPCLGCS